MITELITYPVLFITLYFEVFALVTFLGKDAQTRRARESHCGPYPKVAVVVPCFNEETTIHGTVASLKALEYPAECLHLYLVNDGSTDGTAAALRAYESDPQITVVHKENGGKHTALNYGIDTCDAVYVGCLDADSFVHPSALMRIIPHFTDARVGAVTSSLAIFKPRNVVEKMQHAEYVLGIALRHILAAVGGLYVTPGPFSIYRKSTLQSIGGFRAAHQTEDMEIALRMQSEGWKIENAPTALVFTKAPRTPWRLIKQRTRWTSGFLRNAIDYRRLFGNPRYGVLGLLVLPLAIVSVITGIGVFVMSLTTLITNAMEAIHIQGDVPLSFLLHMPTLDWFFIPLSSLMLLALATLAAAAALIMIGGRISGVPDSNGLSIMWYVLLCSTLAPVWLMRSVADVSFGVKRSWR